MRDDELLAIYGATRQLAEGMTARDAELKQSTAALEATIVQVRQLPAMLGQSRRPLRGRSGRSRWRPTMRGRRLGTSRRRPASRPGPCSPSSWLWVLLWKPSERTSSYPAGVGVEQPFRPFGANAGHAPTCCGHPRPTAGGRKKHGQH